MKRSRIPSVFGAQCLISFFALSCGLHIIDANFHLRTTETNWNDLLSGRT